MTVSELITLLQQHDPNHMVMINGYEQGFGCPTPESVQLVQMYDNSFYDDSEAAVSIPVVVISRSAMCPEDRHGYGGKWETDTRLNYL